MAVIIGNDGMPRAHASDACPFIFKAFVADDDRFRSGAGANPRESVAITPVISDRWMRLLSYSYTRHTIFVAVIVLHEWPCVSTGSDSNTCTSVLVALVSLYQRLRPLTDANARANIAVAVIVYHRWARMRMTDAGIEILKAGVSFDDRNGTSHGTDPSAHVTEADVVVDPRGATLTFEGYARISDMVDDVVTDGTGDAFSRDASDPR